MTKQKVEREVFSIGKALFESVLIVVSVVLGFVVSEWSTHAKERELAASVRRSVAVEVADNLQTIDAQIRQSIILPWWRWEACSRNLARSRSM